VYFKPAASAASLIALRSASVSEGFCMRYSISPISIIIFDLIVLFGKQKGGEFIRPFASSKLN
jgi:hypothetical protein